MRYNTGMYYIVGLGNPGEKYARTRHNVGWLALDALRKDAGMGEPVRSSQYAGRTVEANWNNEEVTLLYPDTFMNNSGSAVKKLVPKGESERLIVVYDDIDLGIGDLKISKGRGSGGHNGIESIIRELGTKDFVRVRIGIAPRSFWTGKPTRPQGAAMSRHVLGGFRRGEEKQLTEVLERTVSAIETIVAHGPDAAMNEFNT